MVDDGNQTIRSSSFRDGMQCDDDHSRRRDWQQGAHSGRFDTGQGQAGDIVVICLCNAGKDKDMANKPTETNPFAPFMSGSDPAHLGDMMTALVKAQARMMDSILRQNIETLDFVKTRFEKDRAMVAELAEAKDSTEAMKQLQEFWNRSVKDYADEAGKLGAFTAATAEQFVEGMTEEATALSGGAPRRGKAKNQE
jgi:hypothetical protein